MHDARNNSGHMHDAQALAMHDARNKKNAMHVHTSCKNPMISARKKGMGTLFILESHLDGTIQELLFSLESWNMAGYSSEDLGL